MKQLIFGLSLVAALGLNASPLTPEEALARLAAEGPSKAPAVAATVAQPKLAFEVKAEAAENASAYVFNRVGGDGYMVLSADDSAPALLGYSDHGSFDEETAPPSLKAWLEGYARQISWASSNRPARSAAKAEVKQREEVAPKLTTTWNQNAPYWNYCPFQSGKRCYTGCVATAMAQVMNWHKWPEQPTGSVSYVSFYLNATMKMDFDTVRFEWDKMLDNYTTQSPVENIRAVASLMQACGYASEMEYMSGVSGALTWKAAASLVKHFGYDKALSVQKRDWYGTSEWEDMVYNELTTNGPVYYDGSGEGGGHAFVCDGYRASDGFFHFNWGWSGLSDGYFRLDALYPEEQGAGGVAVGYTWDQAIIKGFKKAEPGSEPTWIMAPYAGVRCPFQEQELGKHFSFTGYETNDGFANYSIFPVENLFMGFEVTNRETGEKRYLPRAYSNNDPTAKTGETMEPYTKTLVILAFLPTDLAEGEYSVTPVYKIGENGEWRHMMGSPAFRQSVNMTVEGNMAKFHLADPLAKLNIEIDDLPEYFTSGGRYNIGCNVNNVGTKDFSGTICGVFMTEVNGTVKVAAKGRDEYVNVPAGSTVRLNYISDVATGSIEDGDYGFCFGNSTTGEVISDLYEAFVGNRYGSLILTYFNFDIKDRMLLDANNIEASMEITCPQGTYDGPLALLFSTSKRNFKAEYKMVSSENFQFTAVETKQVWLNGSFPEAQLGVTYYCLPGYQGEDGEFIEIGTNPIPVTIGAMSGVDGVGSETTVTGVAVYTLDGAAVNTEVSELPAGVYIISVTTSDGRTEVSKLCIK